MKKHWILLASIAAIFTLVVSLYWHLRLRPKILLEKHGDELETALEPTIQTINNFETGEEVAILEGILTYPFLDSMLNREFGLGCPQCDYLNITINVQVQPLKILHFSENQVVFHAYVEKGVVVVWRSTGEIKIPCNGYANEAVYTLRLEEGLWKLADVENFQTDTVTPVEVLRTRACPENWEDELHNWLIAA
jgi:hypothetical protein